jgi:hypothetical protein
MIGKMPIQARVSLADMFGGFPLAYKVFNVAAIVFNLFDFGSYVASTASPALYARWLAISQPFTDAVASFVPAVDYATGYLETYHGSYLIPAVRNVLSINFAMLLFFPSCFAVALCIDLFSEPERVLNSIDAVSKRLKAPISEITFRCAIFLLLFFLPVYFGYGSTPYIIGFGVTIIYYIIVLGGNGLAIFVTIYFVMSLIITKLWPHAEHRGRAAPDKPDEDRISGRET